MLLICLKNIKLSILYMHLLHGLWFKQKITFSENSNTDKVASLYGATKKSNELIAHSYAHISNLPCTGLRYFTVYGPWGRPIWHFLNLPKKF